MLRTLLKVTFKIIRYFNSFEKAQFDTILSAKINPRNCYNALKLLFP